jgi:hypothetical protein
MINLKFNEGKKLKFKISLSGIKAQDLRGSLRMMSEDNIEYGFPVKIVNGDVVVEIAPMSSVCGKSIKDGSILDSRLELIADNNYLVPWKDKVKIENPVVVEADLKYDFLKPDIKVSDVSEEAPTKTMDAYYSSTDALKNLINKDKEDKKNKEDDEETPTNIKKDEIQKKYTSKFSKMLDAVKK